MDGGINPDPNDPWDAVKNAETPFMDSLLNEYPSTEIATQGNNVGLPEGQMGNSEVGHSNLGAGRIDKQYLLLINEYIEEGEEGPFFKNEAFLRAIEYAKKNKKNLSLHGTCL